MHELWLGSNPHPESGVDAAYPSCHRYIGKMTFSIHHCTNKVNRIIEAASPNLNFPNVSLSPTETARDYMIHVFMWKKKENYITFFNI